MGIDFGKVFADVAKGVNDAAKGVADFVDNASKEIAKKVDQIQADRAEAQRKADLERLKPLFQEDFERAEFVLPKMIRVDEMDKAHAESALCKDSAGFKTVRDDLTVITIYPSYIDNFGLSFYPGLENCVYYVDPCDRDHYIALDDYFSYMKTQRIAELQRIAQSLGAKHFRVTYKEKSKNVANIVIDNAESGKYNGVKVGAKVFHAVRNTSMSAVRVEAEMRFPGHAPIRPELHYLKKEININNLIEMRMDPLSPLQHQHFCIEMSNSSGINKQDAIRIDALLKVMNVSTNTTVESEVQNEARRILEYEIEF